ncbi:hypothetical protein KJ656_06145 [bacterium]|nr:hypothetical protein [bacterium]
MFQNVNASQLTDPIILMFKVSTKGNSEDDWNLYNNKFVPNAIFGSNTGWFSNTIELSENFDMPRLVNPESISTKYEIDSLNSEDYDLIRPFLANVTIDDDEYIVTIDELSLYSFGDSLNSAVDELIDDIIDLYEEIKVASPRLGKDPQRWKDILSRHILEK